MLLWCRAMAALQLNCVAAVTLMVVPDLYVGCTRAPGQTVLCAGVQQILLVQCRTSRLRGEDTTRSLFSSWQSPHYWYAGCIRGNFMGLVVQSRRQRCLPVARSSGW
jgi:hypothetical protein